ncbi:nucleoside-diphosphate-sugar epimerase [Sinobaca qinghaiensis]|uniref:Nucleoside-diphosphate-sugar epimerase n=1 Tax=Sinobaca qinghaiensis TaxID=342944 RepID=A0A419V767_9BACL|nr:SDR family oxidoreductase [Sinobaca qinghaiensis]RKD75936.1 nucleoside-diphosphate-sugar epimerase [Sinobaca qinghaiensis]
MKRAIVAGASGIIGSHIIQELEQLEDWEVIGISRRKPFKSEIAEYISMDLTNFDETKEKVKELGNITHVFYAAYQDFPPFSKEQIDINTTMFENIVKAVEETSSALEHVTLMQGVKVYGVHLGEFKTPAKENDSRHMPPNFYYNQEDFIRAHQKEKEWNWTILRPDVVAGIAVGNPMNILSVIGVYAAVSKELGLPLRFPGKKKTYEALAQMTDASHLARSSVWAALTPDAHQEVFNITNGDIFRWKHLWPKIAEYFEMDYEEPLELPLTEMMPAQEEVWNTIVKNNHLLEVPYEKAAGWGFGDFVFKCEYDVISDVNKIKDYGFTETINTEKRLQELFSEMKREKILP